MRHAITLYLPWLLSLVTIVMTLMAGNKHRHAWALALIGQVLWLVWIVASRSWGLLPMNLVLWAVYIRNHIRWNSPGTESAGPGGPLAADKPVPHRF